jgi:hypothetical protein
VHAVEQPGLPLENLSAVEEAVVTGRWCLPLPPAAAPFAPVVMLTITYQHRQRLHREEQLPLQRTQ